MVIDTSVLLSMLFVEEDAEFWAIHITRNHPIYISAVTVFESSIVADRQDRGADLDSLLLKTGATIVNVDVQIISVARKAYYQFGKGRHKAKLNLGDCFSYATAKHLNVPLLFKGNDFIHTDIKRIK